MEEMTDKQNVFKSKRGRKKLVLSTQEKIERRLQVSFIQLNYVREKYISLEQ